MTRLLLDFPWAIDEGLGHDPIPYKVILDFLNLLEKTGLGAVPFIEDAEQAIFWNALKNRKGLGSTFGPVIKLLYHCKREEGGIRRARPLTEPTNPILRDSWKRALRDELETLENWRNPQIIFPGVRESAWQPAADEIEIVCEDREGTITRVLASLEKYESHKYATSDIDPWRNLEWLKQPKLGARVNYPCRLPKPPILKDVSIEQLPEMLAEARRIGWKVEGNYYFIPPEDFNPALVDQHDWRKGSAFKQNTKDTKKGKKTGPIDYEGRIWSFDIHEERHWDVQLPDGHKLDISHDGHLVHQT